MWVHWYIQTEDGEEVASGAVRERVPTSAPEVENFAARVAEVVERSLLDRLLPPLKIE